MKKDKKNYKDMLNESFASVAPEQSDELKHTPITVSAPTPTPAKNTAPRRASFFVRYRSVAVACLSLVLVAVIAVAIILNNRNTVEPPDATPSTTDYTSYITLSLNPAFSLTVGSDGVVDSLVADNYDGEVVLDSITADHVEWKESYDTTIKRLIEYAKALGYYETSNGITIDIFTYAKDANVKTNMKNKIKASVGMLSDEKHPLKVEDMAREKMYGYAKEIYEELTEDMDDDDLLAILKGKHSFGQRHEGVADDATVYELYLAAYTLSVMERMSELLEELEEYMEDHRLTPAACEKDWFFLLVKEYVDKCLAWMGDTRRLTTENFTELLATSEPGDDDALEDAIEGLLDGFRGNRGDTMDTAAEILAEVKADANTAYWLRLVTARYPMTDASLMSQVTVLERAYRALMFVGGLNSAGNKGNGKD